MILKTHGTLGLLLSLLLVAGCVVVDPTLLDFGASINSQPLTLTVQGNLEWFVSSEKWVTIDPSSGEGPGHFNLTVKVDRSGLSPGSYGATLIIIKLPASLTPTVTVTMSTEGTITTTAIPESTTTITTNATMELKKFFFLHHSVGQVF